MADVVVTDRLSQRYTRYVKQAGLRGALSDFFHRAAEEFSALSDVSIRIAKGEIVGILGPNGAGKTTLMKLVAGLLHPSEGTVTACGHTPHHRRREFLSQLGLVLGQKSQLAWDLPAADTLLLLKEIYRIPKPTYIDRVKHLSQLFEVEEQLTVPVRKLSLGQRMKCELIASLVHHPRLLLLDEPTIGLDIASQRAMHMFIRRINTELGTTILLSSHYTRDIEELANRAIILLAGQTVYDGTLRGLQRYGELSKVIVEVSESELDTTMLSKVPFQVSLKENVMECVVPTDSVPDVIRILADTFNISAISTEHRPLEDTLFKLFSEKPSEALTK